MKCYSINYYNTIQEWLEHRRIGGTELVNIMLFKSKYGNIIDLYDRLKGETKKVHQNANMQNGKRAEEHIRELFLIENQNYKKVLNKENEILLIQRNDFPEITLSPDCIIENENKELGYIEIKYLEISSENKIQEYMCNLKTLAPHYYYQNLHYFITCEDIKFGQFVVAFHCRKEQRIIIESLKFERSNLEEELKECEEKLKDFIINNLRADIRPSVKIENEKGEQIEWNKLSNIKILKH